MLNAVSATWAISRRPILVAIYDTHGDTEDTFPKSKVTILIFNNFLMKEVALMKFS